MSKVSIIIPTYNEAAARNKGAKKARGKILVFVDADMTFDTKYIQKLIEPIIKNKAKGTFAKEELVSNWEQPLARFWNYQQGIATNRRIPPHHPNQAKVFRAILKTEFNRVEGFSPIGYTDDWTLSAKLGYLAQAAPGATCYHHNPDTFVKIWQQAKWIGKRRYKLQILGKLIALCRASLPVSLIIALIKSIKFKKSGFFVFKLYYDLAIFVSIIESFFTSNHAK